MRMPWTLTLGIFSTSSCMMSLVAQMDHFLVFFTHGLYIRYDGFLFVVCAQELRTA